MKKLAVLLFSLLFIVSACSDPGSDNPVASQQMQKKYVPIEIQQMDASVKTELLPFGLGLIIGNHGGDISMNTTFPTWKGWVSISANLEIPKNAFRGATFIYYYPQYTTTSTDFYPGMTFDKPVYYSVKFEGIDLSGIKSKKDVEFAYISPDGNIEPIKVGKINVDLKAGLLEVVDAELNHFSRYGFVRSIE